MEKHRASKVKVWFPNMETYDLVDRLQFEGWDKKLKQTIGERVFFVAHGVHASCLKKDFR